MNDEFRMLRPVALQGYFTDRTEEGSSYCSDYGWLAGQHSSRLHPGVNLYTPVFRESYMTSTVLSDFSCENERGGVDCVLNFS
jgi:hypothetical protein